MWFVLACSCYKKTYFVEQTTRVGTISEASGLLILTKHNATMQQCSVLLLKSRLNDYLYNSIKRFPFIITLDH